DHIDLTIEPGEIHCLLGENGAGKSTLMNMLYGLLDPTEGQILVDDQPVSFTSPGDAIAAGIGMVHQHFMLIPVFTVAENVMLGNEATGFAGSLDVDAARKRVEEISQQFGFHVNPDSVIEDLPVGVQQRVEIIKALSRDAEVLAVAGVQGNGQTELTEALLGLQTHVTGSIKLDGHELVGRSVRKILDAGVGFVPEDRQEDGLVGDMSIAENLMLNRSFGEPFVKNGTLQIDKLDEFAEQKLKE